MVVGVHACSDGVEPDTTEAIPTPILACVSVSERKMDRHAVKTHGQDTQTHR